MSRPNSRQISERPSRGVSRELPREFLERRNQSNLMGKFYIDENKKPEDMRYNWKRVQCMGKDEKQYQVFLQSNYWKPVPGGRHPEAGGEGESPLIIDGLMLMECPEHIASYMDEEASARDKEAMSIQRQVQNATAGGHPDMPFTKPKFSRTIAADQPIPA